MQGGELGDLLLDLGQARVEAAALSQILTEDRRKLDAMTGLARLREKLPPLLASELGRYFDALKERINPERYGGAPLLGLNGNIFKAHGSSNCRAIRSAILAAEEMIRADLNLRIGTDVARANALLAEPAAAAGAN